MGERHREAHALYEEAIRRREAAVGHLGPLVVRTGQYTGRSPKDKFIVTHPGSDDKIWWGEHNQPIALRSFDVLLTRMQAYLQGRDVFVQGRRGSPVPAVGPDVSMVLNADAGADLLAKKLAEHDVQAWLVNTGWTGGPYGVGERFRIGVSRAVVRAAQSGALDDVEYARGPLFGFEVPRTCPEVLDELLQARATWADPRDYDRKAAQLARLFINNFAGYAEQAAPEVASAGPDPELAAAGATEPYDSDAAAGSQHDA